MEAVLYNKKQVNDRPRLRLLAKTASVRPAFEKKTGKLFPEIKMPPQPEAYIRARRHDFF